MTDEEESEFVLKFGGNLNYSTFLHRNLKFALFSVAKYVLFRFTQALFRRDLHTFAWRKNVWGQKWWFKDFASAFSFMTSFEKMSWFEYWKHAFLKVIRVSCKVLYQHCMLLRYVEIVFWMQKIQRNSSNGQFHCFHYVRKRAPC